MVPLLLGAALGGAAMYLFDPDKGRRRDLKRIDRTIEDLRQLIGRRSDR